MSRTQAKRFTTGLAALTILSAMVLSLTGCHQNQATSSVPTVAEQQQANAEAKAKADARMTPEQQAAAAKVQAAANAGIKPEH